MRKGGGKSKGSSFERDICRRLSLWVSRGTQEDVFWRSAMSGGRSTVAHAKGKRLAAQAGDISCIHSIGEPFAKVFLAECKFYANLDYVGLLSGRGRIAQFWNETKTEATQYGKLPFLIAKQNRQPTTICLDSEGRTELKMPIQTVMGSETMNLHIYDADEFFLTVLPPRTKREREKFIQEYK